MEQTAAVSIPWVVGTIVAIIGLFLGSNVINGILQRRAERKKENTDLDRSNAGKVIDSRDKDADRNAVRIETLEQRMDELQREFNSLMVINAKLETNNEHLEKENERQAAEMKTMRQRIHDLINEVQVRDGKIMKLELLVGALTERIDAYEKGQAK